MVLRERPEEETNLTMKRTTSDWDTPMGRAILRDSSKKTEVTINSTERRAPTDESVRLLKEMRQAAEDDLVDVVQIHSNKLDGKCFVFENHPTNSLRVRFVFDLNGERIDWTVDVDKFQTPEDRLEFLRAEVAKRFAQHLIVAFAPEFAQSILSRS